MSVAVGYLILVLGLVHLFIQVYNRYLLCITDGWAKRLIHHLWFIATIPLPLLGVALLARRHSVESALRFSPDTPLGYLFCGTIIALALFLGLRVAAWILWKIDRQQAAAPLVSESVHYVARATGEQERRGILGPLDTTESLRVVRREIIVPGLGAEFDGFRILQIADVHYSRRKKRDDYFEQVRDVCEKLGADVVTFTGDFLDNRRDWRDALAYHARFRARFGAFAVLGNHDYWTIPRTIIDGIGRRGIRWLGGGERRIFRRGGRALIFAGTDAPWSSGREDWRRLLHRRAGEAVILLSHTPDNAMEAARWGASLVLSGHLHGGEACLPLLGPVFSPSRWGLRFMGGVYSIGPECVLHVSRGVGTSGQGPRILCPPEVCLLTLRAERVEVMQPVKVQTWEELREEGRAGAALA